MAFSGLVSWNATALLYMKGRNAWFHHLMGISHQLNGQRAEMSVGTGIMIFRILSQSALLVSCILFVFLMIF
jgi:hypothetical protein